MTLFDFIDSRLQPVLREEYTRRRHEPMEGLPRGVTVVLAGHRAAGKTSLLPHVATLLGREAVDVDALLAHRSGRVLREWVTADERGFREAERESFASLPPGLVVAVGGGFLSSHASALKACVVVEVPVSFDTYAQRLREDTTRPRLRPMLSLEEELREVYAERSELHRLARPMSFIDFVLRLERGLRSRRVVTLPPGVPIDSFAWRARHAGAELLEVRSDLLAREVDLLPASRALPLLIAQRTSSPLPASWLRHASLVDHEAPSPCEAGREASAADRPAELVSFHSPQPLRTAEALAQWKSLPDGAQLKHVEPLGSPARFEEVLETQRQLIERYGAERVTVLVTGDCALPFRAVLAQRNALDYLALDSTWAAAPGQRLLADAVREAKYAKGTSRLGIIGHGIAHSRSPRVHTQPFDRIDLPAEAPLEEVLRALRPHYRGFAVTNPFKKATARLCGSKLDAVNTLVRDGDGWRGENTDVAGARAALDALKTEELVVLGDGGVTVALREAGAKIQIIRRGLPLPAKRGEGGGEGPTYLWTWPPSLEAPPGLQFHGARVAVIAYGAPGRKLATLIRERGGVPVMLGARWFIAQARRQRELFT